MMKKLVVVMIALVAVAAVAGTGISAKAATKKPTKITLKSTAATVDIKGKVTVSVKSVKPSGASKSVSFQSSNKKVATVSAKGVVTGVKKGTATITATSKVNKKVKATIKITVKDLKATAVKVSPTSSIIETGKSVTLKATVKGATGFYNQGVTWKSSDTSIATVSTKGVVKGIKAGEATITATEKGGTEKASCKITVDDAFTGDFVISAADVKTKIAAGESMLLVDTRGIADNKETAKNAITINWKWISKSELSDRTKSGEAGYARSLPAADVSAKLSELGLGLDDQIILLSDGYVTGGWGDDGRIAWQLFQCGYTNVKIVNGGLSAMKAAGIATQTGPKKATAKNVNIEAIDTTSHDITTEALLENYNDYKIIDVRADEEYNGAVLYNETSGGHLKGAIHIRFTDLFKSDGTLKSREALEKMFTEAGLQKEDKIVTYCTGGIRSAYMQLVLQMLGYENSYNYAESAYRWSNTTSAGTGALWEK